MSITLVTPLSSASPESGLMYLLGAYANSVGIEVTQVRCNGVLPVCDRDEEIGWERSITSCLHCAASQRPYAQWGGIASKDLSESVSPKDLLTLSRTLEVLPAEDLEKFEFNGRVLSSLVSASRDNWAQSTGKMTEAMPLSMQKRWLLSSGLMLGAARSYLLRYRPVSLVVARGDDVISSSWIAAAEDLPRSVVQCAWDGAERAVKIAVRGTKSDTILCSLVIENLLSMRNDVKTWPKEVTRTLDELLSFIGISSEQLSLPIAQ